MSLPGRGGSRGRDKRNPLLALGAAISIAGLGFYLYQNFANQKRFNDAGDETRGNSSSASSSRKQNYRASLSLSLPITFSRDAQHMALLESLVSTLSQYYLVTLIAPIHPPSDSTTLKNSASIPSSSASAGGGIESVAALSHSLSHITNFDSRRVLEYSKEEGRLALARALACDAHCEIMVEATRWREADRDRGNRDEGEDGETTPRADSTASHFISSSAARSMEEDKKVTVLEHYHADMARIRKSSSLLIFLLLPVTSIVKQVGSSLTASELDVETVIQPFLLPGQQELSSRVPGVKVVDERSRAETAGIDQAWSQAAKRVGALSKGWQ